MAEKIITCKAGKVTEKDGKDWVELTDGEGKVHRVFRSIQNNEGVWVHLDKEVDMLKDKIQDGSINGLALKLTKEKKGTFWNVIGVELVENIFVKEAQKQVEDKQAIIKNRSVALSYAKDIAVSGNIGLSDVIHCAEIFYRYMVGDITVDDKEVLEFQRRKGGKGETKTTQKDTTLDTTKQLEAPEEVILDKAGQSPGEEPLDGIIELYKKRGWWLETKKWTSPKVVAHIKSITGKLDIKQATGEELTNVASDLQAQIELM